MKIKARSIQYLTKSQNYEYFFCGIKTINVCLLRELRYDFVLLPYFSYNWFWTFIYFYLINDLKMFDGKFFVRSKFFMTILFTDSMLLYPCRCQKFMSSIFCNLQISKQRVHIVFWRKACIIFLISLQTDSSRTSQ